MFIQEVPGSNSGRETCYLYQGFLFSFLWSLRENAGVVHQIRISVFQSLLKLDFSNIAT